MRLVLLYALRYERDGQAQISDLLSRLQDYGMPRQQLGLVRTMLAHAGADKRVGYLFSNRSFSSRFATMAKQSLRVSAILWFYFPNERARLAGIKWGDDLRRHAFLMYGGQTALLQAALERLLA